ncbi:MAG: complement resistance protein TraT [Alteromonadaceae bacterium]|nr:complement resistance protein TraT [Alteromonadaceae bacterium]
MNKYFSKGLLTIALLSLVTLSGCGAIHTSVAKKNLDVQTKMSQSIFLDPVAPEKRIIYVRVRNTSDKPSLSVEYGIKQALSNRGYRITDNPEEAHYWLQANVLKAGRADKRADKSGLSGALTGGAIGSTMGNGDGKMAMAVAGALLGTMMDASVKDIYYTIITDIRLSERAKEGVTVTESDRSSLTQGTAGTKTVSSVEDVHWKRYQTRIVSVANKVNLTFPEAEPALVKGLVQSISNMF